MNRNIWNYFFKMCLMLCLNQANAQTSSESSFFDIFSINKVLTLHRKPDCFWDENKLIFKWGFEQEINPLVTKGGYQTKGAAGMLPYIVHENQVYVLLARESWGRDKSTYCDLGGAVEILDPILGISDTFLTTLLKEGSEESGELYTFSENEVLEKSYIVSYVYKTEGFYKNFETILALCPVEKFYSSEQFKQKSETLAKNLQDLGQCPWSFQEKDDYQWIKMSSLYEFVKKTDFHEGTLKNIYNEEVNIKFRASFLEILRSFSGIEALRIILERHSDI